MCGHMNRTRLFCATSLSKGVRERRVCVCVCVLVERMCVDESNVDDV